MLVTNSTLFIVKARNKIEISKKRKQRESSYYPPEEADNSKNQSKMNDISSLNYFKTSVRENRSKFSNSEINKFERNSLIGKNRQSIFKMEDNKKNKNPLMKKVIQIKNLLMIVHLKYYQEIKNKYCRSNSYNEK